MQSVILVAHGSPSEPETQEKALISLANKISEEMPGRAIDAATLAKPGSLEAVLARHEDPVIYPYFMAQGWFTKTELPRRLEAARSQARQLEPFGVDPALPDLLTRVIFEARASEGIPADSPLILVAHGSKISRKSRNSVYDMAETLGRNPAMPEIHVALIEEPPFLEDVARAHPDGVCLPFFALRAGHVTGDIPEALQAASYRGRLLPEIGAHREVPVLIAQAISRG
ncbi:sirohydrochlorin chelatase [Thioclava sp. JE_KL1]|uniref:sirohydrochlorin chelatase n=1 Tax=Thioclava sp. JE_KL1 TaxID=2651187 RepID=UPI00128D43F8|nr:CbiX/SirB N-terminal domain-containing protein [Thioclava sp. JE_KL1]MPQ94246.1 cobalamin biosynthesis protein CbiX [Thioclava sp. JE_KL1]